MPVESIGPTVDDLVAALTAHAGYTASSPTDITFGGYAGKQLDLQLPDRPGRLHR